ncbi:MAG: hypothetical protein ACO3C1_10245 [Ilumatobacteraceae bacterium]
MKSLLGFRRAAVVAVAAASSLALVAPAAAAGAKFQSASASVTNTGRLSVSFVEVGAGANQTYGYTARASSAATYVCLNSSGKVASATNKINVAGTVTQSGSYTADRNGKVVGTITVAPVPSNLGCPNGQTLALANVTYTNVSVTDVSNSTTFPVSGTYSRTLIAI